MGAAAASTSTTVLGALRGLIRALDFRVPPLERVGEHELANIARRPPEKAVARVQLPDCASSGDTCLGQELAEAVMTDDGSPPPQRERPGSSL